MASDTPCTLLLFRFEKDECEIVARRAEYHGMKVELAKDGTELRGKLAGCDAVMLRDFAPAARNPVWKLRKEGGRKQPPVLVIVPDADISPKLLDQGNRMQIEILPQSMPHGRRWRRLREACEAFRGGKRDPVSNQRAHFRVPFQVKALLITETETCDISLGGVSFYAARRHEIGDTGRITLTPFSGEEDAGGERGLQFRVASVEPVKHGEHRYRIGAKFYDLSAGQRESLRAVIDLVEPTGEELP